MRPPLFILCFNRTAFLIQKSSLKSSAFRPNPFPRILSKSCRHAAVPNRFLAHFSTSRTNGPRLLSRVKVGTHSALGERSHTAAYTAKQEPSLPRPQRGFVLPAKSLLFRHAFIYIHFPVLCDPSTPADEKSRQNCRYSSISKRFSISLTSGPRLLSRVKVDTTRLSERDRTQGLTRRNRGRFGWVWYHYPRSVPHVSETLRGRGLKRQTLPLLGLGRGCSQRTQRAFGTAMRLCASPFRGVAAPLGCVICLQFGDVAVFSLCAQYFLNVQGWGVSLPSVCFACC